jgi:hypothetical protein
MPGRNPRAPGPVPNLRETRGDAGPLPEAISCGRPFAAMPCHHAQACPDGRCQGLKTEDFGPGEAPERGHLLRQDKIADRVAHLPTDIVGQRPATRADCEAFFRPGHRNGRGLTN